MTSSINKIMVNRLRAGTDIFAICGGFKCNARTYQGMSTEKGVVQDLFRLSIPQNDDQRLQLIYCRSHLREMFGAIEHALADVSIRDLPSLSDDDLVLAYHHHQTMKPKGDIIDAEWIKYETAILDERARRQDVAENMREIAGEWSAPYQQGAGASAVLDESPDPTQEEIDASNDIDDPLTESDVAKQIAALLIDSDDMEFPQVQSAKAEGNEIQLVLTDHADAPIKITIEVA